MTCEHDFDFVHVDYEPTEDSTPESPKYKPVRAFLTCSNCSFEKDIEVTEAYAYLEDE